MPVNIRKHDDSELAHVFLEEAWSKLVSGQGVDSSLLRHDIALSWQRCLKSKLDPTNNKAKVSIKDILEKEKHVQNLLAVAKSHMRSLYEIVKGKHYIVFLTDSEGDILRLIGDKKTSSDAELLTLVPGASCSEQIIGTSSPGVCLIQKKPVQVFSHEHFCQQYHNWCCSAAPILDTQGKLLGTLTLSNNNRAPHPPLLLDLVRITAKSIETEVNLRSTQDDFKKSYHYFNSVVDNLSETLIFFDNTNAVCHLNRNAVKLLGKNSAKLVGQSIKHIAVDYTKTNRQLSNGHCWTVLQLPTPQGVTKVNAYLKVLKSDRKRIGLICEIKSENKFGSKGDKIRYCFDDFICRSRKMLSLIKNAKKIAPTDINVFIQGESGTGKEILAQAIHNSSSRRDDPFVAVNCAAIPNELIQSELFGYEDGAFTGAKKGGKRGKFELAQHGTIFLDEIGDMPIEAQANLLRVLQEKSLTRIGGSVSIPLDIRVIAATNKDLSKDREGFNLREDLFYRLSVFNIHVPPLRERKEDIWAIMNHLIAKHSYGQNDLNDFSFSPQVTSLINTYNWPGNVRELENATIYFLNKIEGSTVSIEDIPEYLLQSNKAQSEALDLQEVELSAIQTALSKYGNNITTAAKVLGISRATLYRKMKLLRIG